MKKQFSDEGAVYLNDDNTPATPEQIEVWKAQEAVKNAKQQAEHEARQRQWEYNRLHAVELSIVQLRKEAVEKIEEADKLERLFKEFPDLLKDTNRWKRVRYYSKAVNSRANRFDISHNCGCCNDSPLEIWPYLETPDGNVYSDPPCFTVGEQHWISGDVPRPGWKEEMQKAGIPEDIIGAVSAHFKEDSDSRKEIAEASSYEDEP
jgi:hypothetical protein